MTELQKVCVLCVDFHLVERPPGFDGSFNVTWTYGLCDLTREEHREQQLARQEKVCPTCVEFLLVKVPRHSWAYRYEPCGLTRWQHRQLVRQKRRDEKQLRGISKREKELANLSAAMIDILYERSQEGVKRRAR